MIIGSIKRITVILGSYKYINASHFVFRLTPGERLLRNGQSKLKVYSTVIKIARLVEKQQRWRCHSLKERRRTTLQVHVSAT